MFQNAAETFTMAKVKFYSVDKDGKIGHDHQLTNIDIETGNSIKVTQQVEIEHPSGIRADPEYDFKELTVRNIKRTKLLKGTFKVDVAEPPSLAYTGLIIFTLCLLCFSACLCYGIKVFKESNNNLTKFEKVD